MFTLTRFVAAHIFLVELRSLHIPSLLPCTIAMQKATASAALYTFCFYFTNTRFARSMIVSSLPLKVIQSTCFACVLSASQLPRGSESTFGIPIGTLLAISRKFL